MTTVESVRGPVEASALGWTLMHEHIFVKNPELEENLPSSEWDEDRTVEEARLWLQGLFKAGISTLVDLTVVGLGRSITRIQRLAEGIDLNVVVATGFYTFRDLPAYFRMHGPGRAIESADPLEVLFIRDIVEGIAGTAVKAAIIKVASDVDGMSPDVESVFDAAAVAHHATGAPITTHANAGIEGGRDQLKLLRRHGVSPDRIVIGHCGDSTDIGYLRELMDEGAYIGLDRFGLTRILSDEQRIRTTVELCRLGYSDRITLSHDAACFSVNSEPSYRRLVEPNWNHSHLMRNVLPRLREEGVSRQDIHQMMVTNPMRILQRAG
ncbi:MAG: phosphotriesterase-related protein [Acidimicrobiia bacterium]